VSEVSEVRSFANGKFESLTEDLVQTGLGLYYKQSLFFRMSPGYHLGSNIESSGTLRINPA